MEPSKSRQFSSETLAAGADVLAQQHCKMESPDERAQMEAELQDPMGNQSGHGYD